MTEVKNLIVRIQRPVDTSVQTDLVLITSEDRAISALKPMTKGIQKLFGDDTVIYVEATYLPGGTLALGNKLEDQKW